MASNEVLAWRHSDSGKLVVACHKKKKPVLMLSTTFSGAPAEAVVGRRQVFTKPDVIVRYNNAMVGVDLADQYCFTHKSVKWWGKVMFWAIEVGIINSYILYK